MGKMKNAINKVKKDNAIKAKQYQDFEDLMHAGKHEYHNTAIQAANAETHALRFALDQMYTMIQEQNKTIAQQQMQINELQQSIMKNIRTQDIDIVQTTTTTTTEVRVRTPKWTKESIFREFDHYRRDNALFSNITPEIVRNNWSTLYTQCPKYVGLTLGQVLQEYADERSINY